MTSAPFRTGLSTLTGPRRTWIAGCRIGLLSHSAALDERGYSSVERLLETPGCHLISLMGPEHGFAGQALAGETVRNARHPVFRIPIHSLYGEQRRPTGLMLRGVDTIVCDLQDLAARPYTYVSTLRLVLEAAAEHACRVIVCDRPVPLPRVVDGPSLAPGFASFVAAIPAPMHYGMTPGETALWMRTELRIAVDLRVARMSGYRRQGHREPGWPPWTPPSPGIRAWEAGQTYTSTVFGEALPSIDNGRGTALAFQVIGAPWMDPLVVRGDLDRRRLPGVLFHPLSYAGGFGIYNGQTLRGLRLTVTDPAAFRPVTTAVHVLDVLQRRYGPRRLWRHAQARPDFFDKLFGTDATRRALQAGRPAADIVRSWKRDLALFDAARGRHLLYAADGAPLR